MKYIEKCDNVTKEYEVFIEDKETINNIILELNENGLDDVKKTVYVTGNSEEEVIAKASPNNLEGFRIIGVVDNPKVVIEGQEMYQVEFVYKRHSYLENILKEILKKYETNDDATEVLSEFLEYEKSGEMRYYLGLLNEKMDLETYSRYDLLKTSYEKAYECISKNPTKKTIHYNNPQLVYKLGAKV